MATTQERAELHKTIWKIANDLRGSVDGWEFKAYVLGSIFYRFISENMCEYIYQRNQLLAKVLKTVATMELSSKYNDTDNDTGATPTSTCRAKTSSSLLSSLRHNARCVTYERVPRRASSAGLVPVLLAPPSVRLTTGGCSSSVLSACGGYSQVIVLYSYFIYG